MDSTDPDEIGNRYTSQKCLTDFAVLPSKVRDKHAIRCPHCGHINDFYREWDAEGPIE